MVAGQGETGSSVVSPCPFVVSSRSRQIRNSANMTDQFSPYVMGLSLSHAETDPYIPREPNISSTRM